MPGRKGPKGKPTKNHGEVRNRGFPEPNREKWMGPGKKKKKQNALKPRRNKKLLKGGGVGALSRSKGKDCWHLGWGKEINENFT